MNEGLCLITQQVADASDFEIDFDNCELKEMVLRGYRRSQHNHPGSATLFDAMTFTQHNEAEIAECKAKREAEAKERAREHGRRRAVHTIPDHTGEMNIETKVI